jgi:hypothetical protein
MQTPKVKMRMRPPLEILTQVIPGLPFWLSELKPVCESLLRDAPPHATLLVPDRRIDLDEHDCASTSINEGLAWLKTRKKRHEELLALRNDNAHRERRFYGASADKEIVKEPVYDVKVLDRLVTRVAREIRLLEQALKATNARTTVDAYDQDDAVLGELA